LFEQTLRLLDEAMDLPVPKTHQGGCILGMGVPKICDINSLIFYVTCASLMVYNIAYRHCIH